MWFRKTTSLMASIFIISSTATSYGAVSRSADDKLAGLTPGTDYPRLDLAYLTNPDTLGAKLKWKNDNLVSVWGKLLTNTDLSSTISVFEDMPLLALGVDIDATASKDFHPTEDAKFGIKGTSNWYVKGKGVTATFYDKDGNPISKTIYTPYLGKFKLDVGGEAAPIKKGENGQSWDFKDYNVGVSADQQIPCTDVDPFFFIRNISTTNLAVTPITLSASYKRVFQTNPTTTSYNRETVGLDWALPLAGSVGYFSSYLYPFTEWTWNDGATNNFTSVEVDIYALVIKKIAPWATPVVFARYETGKKAPEFRQVDDWHIGVGTTVLW